MKKIVLSVLFAEFSLFVFSQTLITENFDALNVGNMATTSSISYGATTAAQGGWSIISHLTVPDQSYFQVQSYQASNKWLALSGSPTPPGAQTGSNYVQKNINWSTRTVGNDVVYAECLFNTGSVSVSKNEFYFALYNTNKSKCLGGFIYVHDTHLLKGLAYDSTDVSAYGNYAYSSIGTGSTALILEDTTDYYLVVGYDVNTGKTSWYVSKYATQNVPLCNASKQNQSIIFDPALLITAAKAGASNTASSTVFYDNISVQARPCYKYTTQASADFVYTGGMHCIGTSDLIPAILDPLSTGVFSSTPSGLEINATNGVINMTTSQAGTYSVTFITNNAGTCIDTVTTSITLTSSSIPTFSIIDLICSGGTVPILPSTSNNSIAGTWSPDIVNNTNSGVYIFTPSSEQCVLPITKTINVVTTPLTPIFSVANNICTGSSAPILATTSDNAVTGTWTPPSVSNTSTGTYTFTPITGSCATPVSTTITVTSNVTPIFTVESIICSGDLAPILETTSNNSITGTWMPSIVSNTATGTYTFTPDSGECATSTSTTVTVFDCSGIDEQITSSYFIFPNPANDLISITFSESLNNTGEILLVSAEGKIIEQRNHINSLLEQFDISALKAGIYFFQINHKTEKIIIQ